MAAAEPGALGILAGSGALPGRLIEACAKAGRPVFVLAFTGAADPAVVDRVPHAWIRLGQAGTGLKMLRDRGVRELVMAGGVQRPSPWTLRPDWRTLKFFAALGWRALGDDGLLRAVIHALEAEGFAVTGAESMLRQDLAPEGLLGAVAPDPAAAADIALGLAAAREHGTRDKGQAVVVASGTVVDRESADGTDALLTRCRGRAAGGVLVKTSKPGQERRADLPAIGPDTVAAAAAAGLKGIVVEAGATLLIDRAAIAAAADRTGVFVLGARVPQSPAEAGRATAKAEAPLIYLIAGEPSGDALGANLMRALRYRTQGAVRFAGIGGEQMAAEGLASLFPLDDLAVMGVAEVLPRARAILKRVREAVADIRARNPSAVVTIDSSGFNWRVAQRLRRAGETVPLIHYVAPMVWAWRAGRARRLARWYDHLMALLPFEPPYFEKIGLSCSYVGHPVVEMGADKGDRAGFRRRHEIPPLARVVAILPGSRGGEVGRLLPILGATLALLAKRFPDLMVVVAATANVEARVKEAVAAWDVDTVVVGAAEKYDAFAASDAALAASGTVALELTVARVPTVVTYRVNPLTHALLRRIVKVRYANLVNLILDRPAVPELLQADATPEKLAAAIERLLEDQAARAAQISAGQEALQALGYGQVSPGLRAADEVLARLRR
ncbi:MAG: lipid-A-disaccharide synthase [Alphaproteobacteria bacterium]|nr:lipid-A-disaccharide synthase [Alphaproteobacteria bacterium]